MTISEFIDKILEETANPVDGSGFFNSQECGGCRFFYPAGNSRLTELIFATTATIEPAASASGHNHRHEWELFKRGIGLPFPDI